MQKVTILGSTGSIGISTLQVLRLHPELYEVFALTGYNNIKLLAKQCIEFKPKYAFIQNQRQANHLAAELKNAGLTTKVLSNQADLSYLASHSEVDMVMSAIVGSAGLMPTYQAALSGKRILLANKETLVAGGRIISNAVKKGNAELIPVDSEHSAVFQALPANFKSLKDAGVNKIILTASGGPFLNYTYEQLEHVTAAEAVKHPNWSMGQKISVDSATLMNKGLEVIEAHWLFNASLEQLEVVIHPQSIIHSMVEYIDGSIIAQLGTPDMRTPIAYALSSPKRIVSGSSKLDFLSFKALTFAHPDFKRFPCLQLALESLRIGDNMPAVINASNEVAVAKFLNNEHGFYDIPRMLEKAMRRFSSTVAADIDSLLELDIEVRKFCLG